MGSRASTRRGASSSRVGPLAPRTLAQSPVTVKATASSGLTVTFSTTTPRVCTSAGTNGAKITFRKAATCVVEASQAGNADYSPAPSISDRITVSKAGQTIKFKPLANQRLSQSPVTVHATASSRLTVTFTTITPVVCTSRGTNGLKITLLKAGTCVVVAHQRGNATYSAARTVSRHFTVTEQ